MGVRSKAWLDNLKNHVHRESDGDPEMCYECLIPIHPPTEDCPNPGCNICSVRDCQFHCDLHYDKDGCPFCFDSDHDSD